MISVRQNRGVWVTDRTVVVLGKRKRYIKSFGAGEAGKQNATLAALLRTKGHCRLCGEPAIQVEDLLEDEIGPDSDFVCSMVCERHFSDIRRRQFWKKPIGVVTVDDFNRALANMLRRLAERQMGGIKIMRCAARNPSIGRCHRFAQQTVNDHAVCNWHARYARAGTRHYTYDSDEEMGGSVAKALQVLLGQ